MAKGRRSQAGECGATGAAGAGAAAGPGGAPGAGAISYLTMRAGAEATAEFVDRKSRFIAQLTHVASEDETAAFSEAVRARHYDARHNVPAWILAAGRERASEGGCSAEAIADPGEL